jgi:hypothetical protein
LSFLLAQPPITAYACEGTYITVSCPSPYRISVIRAVYGPPSEKMCNKCNDCGHCTFADVTSYFSEFNGQTSGSLHGSSIAYGINGYTDPCFGRTKVTILSYYCITISTYSSI